MEIAQYKWCNEAFPRAPRIAAPVLGSTSMGKSALIDPLDYSPSGTREYNNAFLIKTPGKVSRKSRELFKRPRAPLRFRVVSP